jgi:hypothetical protein
MSFAVSPDEVLESFGLTGRLLPSISFDGELARRADDAVPQPSGTSVDSAPFGSEESQWTLALEEVMDGIW